MSFSEEQFLDLLQKVSFEPRLAGTKNERESFDFLKKYIEKNIGGKTFLQNYKILTWRQRKPAVLEVAEKEINCQTVYYSPTAKIKGRLEFFQKDESETDNEMDIYSIVDRGGNVSGIISVLRNFEDPFYYNKGAADYLIPDVIVGKESASFLKENIGKKVFLQTSADFPVKKSFNLIHKLQNRKGKFKLILGAHVDTVPNLKGIVDDGTGIASLLLISEELKKMKLPFDVWVIYFGSEENAMFGSKFFIDTLNNSDKEKVKFMLAIDGIGISDKFDVFTDVDYFPQIEKAFSGIASQMYLDNIDEAMEMSDHHYFKMSGIDSCFIEGKIEDNYCHNKKADSLEVVDAMLCVKINKGILEFIKDIQFKSPDIEFKKRTGRNFGKICRKLFRL